MPSIQLPRFRRTKHQLQWVSQERETASWVPRLWRAAGTRIQRDPDFLTVLVQSAWTNARKDESGWEATREWRNQKLAEYFGLSYDSDFQPAAELSKRLPSLSRPVAFLGRTTGITHYYTSMRPQTLQFVRRHADVVALAFKTISETGITIREKISSATQLIMDLGTIRVRNQHISPLNGLTPVLACLDPSRRFPIMNVRTRHLLHAVNEKQDAHGGLALTRLIGASHPGVRDAFELDVYACTETFSKIKRLVTIPRIRDVGIKSEAASFAHFTANKAKIQKLHNSLINRLRDSLQWRYRIQESDFDALIPNWKRGRHLLIEVKTASSGPGGRAQIRQAIGQLFDYRYSHFQGRQTDLAMLLPRKPPSDVESLLRSLKIEFLWFNHRELEGTIKRLYSRICEQEIR